MPIKFGFTMPYICILANNLFKTQYKLTNPHPITSKGWCMYYLHFTNGN